MIRRIPHDQLRDESIQLRGPSRHERRHPKAISYVSSDLAAERPARAAHVLHMTPARVDPQPGGRKCANARNFSRGDPTFYYVHTSEHPLRPPGCKGAPRRAHSAPCGPDGARTVFWQIPGAGKGIKLRKHPFSTLQIWPKTAKVTHLPKPYYPPVAVPSILAISHLHRMSSGER